MAKFKKPNLCKPSLIHGGFLLFLLVITSSSSASTISWPLNIETHYPYPQPPPVPPPVDSSPTTITPPPPPPRSLRTSKKKIAAAVVATAATTFTAVGLLFLFWSKYSSGGPSRRSNDESRSEFTRLGGKVKGFIVDEDGLDVIYWRNLKSNSSHSRSSTTSFSTAISSGSGVGGGGQPPPAPLPPEKKKKKIALIPPPPPPPNNRRGERGSFQYNGDMMEAMFGVMVTNRNSPIQENPNNMRRSEPLNPNTKIFILDPQKSRNTTIVLKSLGVPPHELFESLLKGKGLSIEALEKLVRIAPTRKEESEIMEFNGDPTRLAETESFFYSFLKVVPSAFTRANAMLFVLRYESEIGTIKESLRTLDSACNELMRSEALLKLLEAILNAGIQLNGGTSTARDVKAFSLRRLLKLSDYRSSDGKTTLLHFVVHKVVRNEGRRCSLTRINSRNDFVVKAEKEREFLRLGLPVVGGLSSDFSDVRKAACLDYEACWSSLVSLRTRVDETRQLVGECEFFGGGRFVEEMGGFLESAEAEIKAIREERIRVMGIVKRATQHYEDADASDGNPLQLFVLVKELLGMVDQACVEIARSLQQKEEPTIAVSRSGSSQTDVLRTRVTFPRLPDHFLSG